MTTLADIRTDLSDRIDDTVGALPNATRDRYINHGIRAMWPKIYQTLSDTTLELIEDTFEYTIPAAFNNAKIIRVELEIGDGEGRYIHLYDYEIVPLQESKILALKQVELPAAVGSRIRIIGARPLATLSADADVFEGPPGTEEIPVWYALGVILSRGIEPRTNYARYTTTVAANGVDIEEVMATSQFCFSQFQTLLDQYEMPLPAQAG